jgi:hypothetical protein
VVGADQMPRSGVAIQSQKGNWISEKSIMIKHLALLLTFTTSVSHAPIFGPIEHVVETIEQMPICASKDELIKHYHAIFNRLISYVENQILQLSELSLQQWQERRSEIQAQLSTQLSEKELKQAQLVPLSQRIAYLVHDTLNEFGMDVSAITALHDTEMRFCGGPMSVFGDRLLLVYEAWVTKLSDHEIRAILAHEIQHLKFQDNISRMLVDSVPWECNGKINEVQPLMYLYYQLRELRADVFAALQSPYYALATEHMQIRLKYDVSWLSSETRDYNHPTGDQRTRIARIVGRQLQNFEHATDLRMDSLQQDMKVGNLRWFLGHSARFVLPVYCYALGTGCLLKVAQVVRSVGGLKVKLWNRRQPLSAN